MLQYLEVGEAKEMVGVHLAPDGNQEKQVEELVKKAQSWASYIKSAHLGHEATWKALQTTIIKSIEYPLVACTLSKEECISVMTPVLDAALPRSNFAARFARASLYGPVQYQGMGLHNPYISQGIRHIKDIVEQVWKNTVTGQLIQGTIESAQLESGLYSPIFWNPQKIKWWNTGNTWIIQTHQFCCEHKISIQTGDAILPQCVEDRSIMAEFDKLGYTKTEMRNLNRCRLYLQVTSLSEITNGRGTQIVFDRHPRKSNEMHWPHQGRPTNTMWTEWENALQKCFGNNTQVLQQALGHWTVTSTEYHEWEWFLGIDDALYQYTDGKWIQYASPGPRRTRSKQYTQDPNSPIFLRQPCEMQRTTVVATGQYLMHTGVRDWHQEDPVKGTTFEA